MKTISKIFTLLSVLLFMSSCSEDVIEVGGMGYIEVKGLHMTFNKNVINADGNDSVTFSVYYDGNDVSDQSSIFLVENGKYTQIGRTFSVDKVGEYIFAAGYRAEKLLPGDVVKIYAVDRDVPSAPKDDEQSNTSFVRRAFFNQYTGALCPNCPYMTYLLKKTLTDGFEDKVVLASIRNYAGEIGFESISTPRFYPYLYIDYISSYPQNGDVSVANYRELQDLIELSTSGPAKVGISAAPLYFDDGQLIVTVSVKAAETDEYNVGLWLMQDDYYRDQAFKSDNNGALGGTWVAGKGNPYDYHNNSVRIAKSEYLGSHVGYPLGKIEAGKTAQWTFLIQANIGQEDSNCDGKCDISDSWWEGRSKINLDDLHFAAFVTTHKGSRYSVVNAIDFKYNETKPFEYIK